ncbi:hypothetical protein ACVIU4_000445 [Bradyrhizobium barranii subsp. barranii]|nr:hypothetical protein [Bradyrhizobium japonicum]MCP1963349.1 hypothetical protein [Bradyrhizobium japonicum]
MVKIEVGPFKIECSTALGAVCFMVGAFLVYAARIQGAL